MNRTNPISILFLILWIGILSLITITASAQIPENVVPSAPVNPPQTVIEPYPESPVEPSNQVDILPTDVPVQEEINIPPTNVPVQEEATPRITIPQQLIDEDTRTQILQSQITPLPTRVVDRPPTSTPDAYGVIYVEVLEGDAIWFISERTGVPVPTILELNGFTPEDGASLRIGQKIVIGYGEQQPVVVEPTWTPVPTWTPEPTWVIEPTVGVITPTGNFTEVAQIETITATVEPTETVEPMETIEPTDEPEETVEPTPWQSPTPTITPTPWPTNTPWPTSTPLPTKATSAELCLYAFDDQNEDGVLTGTEPLRAGVIFTIYLLDEIVESVIADNTQSEVCVELNAGTYLVVREEAQEGETITSAPEVSLSLTAGVPVNIGFGSSTIPPTPYPPSTPRATATTRAMITATRLPTATPTPIYSPVTPTNTAESSNTTLLLIAGFGLVGLVISAGVYVWAEQNERVSK